MTQEQRELRRWARQFTKRRYAGVDSEMEPQDLRTIPPENWPLGEIARAIFGISPLRQPNQFKKPKAPQPSSP